MKAINIKQTVIMRMIITIALAAIFTSVNSQSLKDKKISVNESLANINAQQLVYAGLRAELVKAAIVEKPTRVYQDWVTAKANLKIDRLNLILKARSLMKSHHKNIREYQKKVMLQERVLMKAQVTVDQLAVKRDVGLLQASENLILARDKFRNSLNELEHARLDRDKDRFIINKELTDLNGESDLQIAVEGEEYATQNVEER